MLFYILLLYLVLAYIFPPLGWLALICMLGPVTMSFFKGRYWCGHICPRGNLYDRVLSRFSPGRPIPRFLRSKAFRAFMLCLIFTMFGVQMAASWGDLSGMGLVFWRIILITTLVAIALSLFYAPRTWCTFCPMGTLSALVAPRGSRAKRSKTFRAVTVSDDCIGCKRCAKICPMQLEPHTAKGLSSGFQHPDCIKCGRCVKSCGKGAMKMESTKK